MKEQIEIFPKTENRGSGLQVSLNDWLGRKTATMYRLSILLDRDKYVIRYWCKEFGIEIRKDKVLEEDIEKLAFIKKCLNDDRLSIIETKKRLIAVLSP